VLGEHVIERLRLRHSARKTVENEAFAGIRLGDPLFDDTDHHIVRTKRAAGHNAFDLTAQRCRRLDRGPQHIAGGELNDTVLGDEVLGLSPFARPRRAQQDQSHRRRPLNFDLFIKPSYWCASR